MLTTKLTALGSALACCLLACTMGFGQGHAVQVKGTVKGSADGTNLAGTTVTLDKEVATVTDAAGHFSLTIPAAKSAKTIRLTISSVGFVTRVVTLEPGQTDVNVVLDVSRSTLNEVVVTALGINRQKRSLGYAMTTVAGNEFTQARENNVANALTGKIAGVNAVGLSTGPGGSSRVTIRGNGSLVGDNQPLYVINGMPIDNSVPGGAPTANGITFNIDRGDGIADINPDDIESISVLKGGTAAALYGSRASNGVILITTKKGRAQKGIGVDYNTTATFQNVAVVPDFQYTYGQGINGVMPTTLAAAQASGRRSWGAPIDGSTNYVGVDGKTHPYTAKKDNYKNYYQTGSAYTNTLALVGGGDVATYRFSASDLSSKGILPNTTYSRKTFNLSVDAKLGSRITLEGLAQYNQEIGHDRTGAGDALGNPNWTPLEIANTADVRWLKPGFDANGNETIWNDAAIASNGYFVINKWKEDDTKNRFIGQASIAYRLLQDLVVKGTISQDFYNYNFTDIVPTGTLYVPQGQYQGIKSDVNETNSLLTATYHHTFLQKLGVNVLAGANSRKFQNSQLTMTGAGFTIPYFYSFANLSSSSVAPYTAHTATNSVFGSVDLDWNSLFYLTLTGRQDWFSTLSPQHNRIFYPSIGGSFILSDAVKLPEVFNQVSLRGSWAQVGGGEPTPYSINLSYSNVPSSGQPLLNVTPDPTAGTNVISNPNLKPFTSTTTEAGLALSLLKSRLGLDLTWYDRKTTNDIVNTAISTTSGYSNAILNIGELDNKGVEVLVTGTPIRSANFSWDVSYNVAYNNNKVIQLAPGLNSIQLATSVGGWAFLDNIVGKPFGTLVGTSMLRDAKGDTVFNANTKEPVVGPLHPLGNSVAPLTMGLTNEFHYKRFGLSFLLDGKFGNKVFSIFELYATRMGKLKTTLAGRAGGLTVHGVDQNGDAFSNTVLLNPTSGLALSSYYDNYKTYSDLFLHDGSFVKLRQVIFSYNIPVSRVPLVRIQSANVSFVARNLLILYRKTRNFDPEQSFTNSSSQGFESIGLPNTRSYGLNLAVKF
ncbi:SusC/RagA family TonB-linked outer membrane protein [Dinghuibacter silviterrae]|uniref:TonB-linked SusC/RagA family outer membrane protein n=1 Tax=Dinghuibacter silviterrae TaxID=1539049 RepID=A0A4R8DXS4_9BACT|nr:SusC/RagA family TonB-linked outer membrane protein [Dinghuibacter silviterrae]TDX02355.1 TonB-linked SusC/RagA family outer membrane protein [Dinghuibacter silviterrae]